MKSCCTTFSCYDRPAGISHFSFVIRAGWWSSKARSVPEVWGHGLRLWLPASSSGILEGAKMSFLCKSGNKRAFFQHCPEGSLESQCPAPGTAPVWSHHARSRNPEIQKFRTPQIQNSRNSEINLEIQKFRTPEIQKYRDPELQRSRTPGNHNSRNPEINLEILKSRNPEIQRSRTPEI